MTDKLLIDRSVLEQALEALDEADLLMEHRQNIELRRSALVALRAALEQPQPKREPLTDEQLDALRIEGRQHWLGKRQIARAIERAHGIVGE